METTESFALLIAINGNSKMESQSLLRVLDYCVENSGRWIDDREMVWLKRASVMHAVRVAEEVAIKFWQKGYGGFKS